MAKKIKNTKTPEQRKAEAAELHAKIAAGVESLTDSQQWEKYLGQVPGSGVARCPSS